MFLLLVEDILVVLSLRGFSDLHAVETFVLQSFLGFIAWLTQFRFLRLDFHTSSHPFLIFPLLVELSKQSHLVFEMINVLFLIVVELLDSKVMHFLAHSILEERTLRFDIFQLLCDLGVRILLVFKPKVSLTFIRFYFFQICFVAKFTQLHGVNFTCWEFKSLS